VNVIRDGVRKPAAKGWERAATAVKRMVARMTFLGMIPPFE
jgi:hypothetical protein